MVAAVTRLLVTLVKSISGVWWGQKPECSGLMRKQDMRRVAFFGFLPKFRILIFDKNAVQERRILFPMHMARATHSITFLTSVLQSRAVLAIALRQRCQAFAQSFSYKQTGSGEMRRLIIQVLRNPRLGMESRNAQQGNSKYSPPLLTFPPSCFCVLLLFFFIKFPVKMQGL